MFYLAWIFINIILFALRTIIMLFLSTRWCSFGKNYAEIFVPVVSNEKIHVFLTLSKTFSWIIVLFLTQDNKTICKNYTNSAKADVTTRIYNFAIHLWPLSLRGLSPPLRYNSCSLRSRLRGVSSPTPRFAHRRCGYTKGKSKRKVAHIPGHQTAIDLSAEPRKWFGHWHHLDLT